MPAYLILDILAEDPEESAAYRERAPRTVEEAREVCPPPGQPAPATIEAYGGRYLVRGGEHEVVEGDWNPERIVVVEFPSVERAREWYRSPEYQEIAPMRQRAAPSRVVLVQGVE